MNMTIRAGADERKSSGVGVTGGAPLMKLILSGAFSSNFTTLEPNSITNTRRDERRRIKEVIR